MRRDDTLFEDDSIGGTRVGVRDELGGGLPATENKLFYPGVDGLRAVAILMVFFYHYNPGVKESLVSFGWAGVDVFFVLSGFLITGILYDSRNDAHRSRTFYARRALRIFPLYYGVLALLLLSTPAMHWNWSRYWLAWPVYLGNLLILLKNVPAGFAGMHLVSANVRWNLSIAHFWSLCVEEQFYLVWPLVVFTLRDRVRLRNLCVVAVVATPILRTVLLMTAPATFNGTGILNFVTLFRMDALLLGGALALMLRGPEAERVKRRAAWLFWGGAVMWCACWVLGASVLHEGGSLRMSVPWVSAVGVTFVDLMAGGMLLLAIQPERRMYRWLSVPGLRRLGQISYGIYVFHEIPHAVYDKTAHWMIGGYTTHTGPLRTLIASVCTYALATVSYRYFEAPFLRLKNRFTMQSHKESLPKG